MTVHLFGIRHHGVGSTRTLIAALHDLKPDCILIEGPPDADALIPMARSADMIPPVSILVYNPDRPQQAAWYPFTVYSPEWQAIQYGLQHELPVAFMDLPYRHQAALRQAEQAEHEDSDEEVKPTSNDTDDAEVITVPSGIDTYDPLQQLAALAGETDGERWWNRVVEEGQNPIQVFDAIQEAMGVLRTDPERTQRRSGKSETDLYRESRREAWMRKTIRAAEKQYSRIAVICGAWHVPALVDRTNAEEDTALLKGLPSVKSIATFAPWTYGRIAQESGYGAGIASPGWYHHLWETSTSDSAVIWLAKVAALLREEGLLASTAQVIDAFRLAETVAAIRGRASIGLEELNEASIAVFSAGRIEPLALIRRKLIISDRMGSIPPDAPAVPLQQDFATLQKKLRLKQSLQEPLDLDLRTETDLARSQLFHRLQLLDIPWAKPAQATIRSQGTFHEFWTLIWTPELTIRIIEQSVWGNTVAIAAGQFTRHRADEATALKQVADLIQPVMLAELPAVMHDVLQRLDSLATTTTDNTSLLESVPPLTDVLRYGNVRATDIALIAPVLDALVIRACIGLPAACSGITDEVASTLYEKVDSVHSSLQLLERPDVVERWQAALRSIAESTLDASGTIHPLLSGTAARLLFRAQIIGSEQTAKWMRAAFSPGIEPAFASQWLEGFLGGMEQVVVRDDSMFRLIDEWVVNLSPEAFESLLPVLRRTFSTFGAPSRRILSEQVLRGQRQTEQVLLDEARAVKVLPIMCRILRLEQS